MHVLSVIDRPLSIPFLLFRKYKWVSHLLVHVLAPHKGPSSITGEIWERTCCSWRFIHFFFFPLSCSDIFFSQPEAEKHLGHDLSLGMMRKIKKDFVSHLTEELLAHLFSGSKTFASELVAPDTLLGLNSSSNVPSFFSSSKYLPLRYSFAREKWDC